jgi:hypothetical protein
MIFLNNSFLHRNRKPVDLINFQELCVVLGQEWRDIACFDIADFPSTAIPEIPEGQVAIAFLPSIARPSNNAVMKPLHKLGP